MSRPKYSSACWLTGWLYGWVRYKTIQYNVNAIQHASYYTLWWWCMRARLCMHVCMCGCIYTYIYIYPYARMCVCVHARVKCCWHNFRWTRYVVYAYTYAWMCLCVCRRGLHFVLPPSFSHFDASLKRKMTVSCLICT